MEDLKWSNVSSILPMSSVPELSAGNVEESCILEILQQFDFYSTLVQSNGIIPQHPLKQIEGQLNPSLVDNIVLTNSRSVIGWGNDLPQEIPASSSGTSDNQIMQTKPEIYQNDSLNHVVACQQQVDSTSCNDAVQFSYSYDVNQQCSESLDCVPTSCLQMDDGMSPTSTTEQDAIGNIKSREQNLI
ncbi:hypothetical protein SUGI_0442250 [Cryptomeria japonica]|nr:hypothetical protein SUGI_0442250 [Cryptomeria japonica]